jgi:hypothetical protein
VDGEIASPHPAQALGGSGAVANPHSEQNEPADNELHLGQIILSSAGRSSVMRTNSLR